eukprot:5644575-Amphidinium_carterae.1
MPVANIFARMVRKQVTTSARTNKWGVEFRILCRVFEFLHARYAKAVGTPPELLRHVRQSHAVVRRLCVFTYCASGPCFNTNYYMLRAPVMA